MSGIVDGPGGPQPQEVPSACGHTSSAGPGGLRRWNSSNGYMIYG